MSKHTTGPWFVRTRVVGGEVVDCFVAAKDTQGLPYDAEILGDDEYRDGIERKLADARLIAAAPDMLAALNFLNQCSAPMTSQQEECWKLVRSAISKATGELFNAELSGPQRPARKDEE